jgi:hypothetical protein
MATGLLRLVVLQMEYMDGSWMCGSIGSLAQIFCWGKDKGGTTGRQDLVRGVSVWKSRRALPSRSRGGAAPAWRKGKGTQRPGDARAVTVGATRAHAVHGALPSLTERAVAR